MDYFFHVTESDRKNQIMRDGLEARYASSMEGISDETNGVFLFTSLNDAMEYMYLNWTDGEAEVIEVILDDDDVQKLVIDPAYDAGCSFFFPGDIDTFNLSSNNMIESR